MPILCSDGADGRTEEERKALIAMLGKLHVSANSRTEKLLSTTGLVVEAIDGRVAHDAPSRNALKKLQSVLSKALGDAEKVKPIAVDSSGPAGGDNDLIALDQQTIEESIVANEEGVGMGGNGDESVTEVQDSMLRELLELEEDEM